MAASLPPTVCFSSRLHPHRFTTGTWDRAPKKKRPAGRYGDTSGTTVDLFDAAHQPQVHAISPLITQGRLSGLQRKGPFDVAFALGG